MQKKDNETPMETEWSDIFGGPSSAGFHVVKDSAAWADLWRDLGRQDPPPADFTKVMAVAVFLGLRSTGGYSIKIEKAAPVKKKLVVEVRIKEPSKSGFVIQALTSPYHIKLIERSDLPVVFKKRK